MKSRFFRLVVPVSLLLNLVLGFAFIRRKIYFSTHDKPDTTWADNYNKEKSIFFEKMPVDSTDIVFIGDSITEGFPLTEMFPNAPVKNRGIAANLSRHVLGRINTVLKHKPKKILLEVGVNDLTSTVGADSLFENYTRLIQLTKQAGVTLYVHSVFPVCGIYSKYNPAIINFNNRLQKYCFDEHVPFINVYPDLCKHGQLDSSYTYDGVHLNGEGYRVWADKINSVVTHS